jgi:hypothetical protein
MDSKTQPKCRKRLPTGQAALEQPPGRFLLINGKCSAELESGFFAPVVALFCRSDWSAAPAYGTLPLVRPARKGRALGIMAATLSQPDHWMNASC